MKIAFLGQPITAFGGGAASWLQEQLRDPTIHEIRVAVAWAKRSGLARVAGDFTAFNGRIGTLSSLLVGIDEGGATKQGLQLALELFDKVSIFHEPGSRTYHPKVYIALGQQSAELLVGSNNMTAGGLYANYEAALRCRLDLTEDDDQALLTQVIAWFDTLRGDTNVCKPLTPELLATLISDARYNIGDEDAPRRSVQGKLEDAEGVTTDTPAESVFSRSMIAKTGMPSLLPTGSRPVVSPIESDKPEPTVPGVLALPRPSTATTSLLWQKKLSKADAQQPNSERTNRTGNLKLTQSRMGIDQRTYFRNDLFGDLTWEMSATSEGVEYSYANFRVRIDNHDYGQHLLRISHKPSRGANQSNILTWLHWGSELAQVLREINYTGAWVTIERYADGTYRLEISRNEDRT
ncbi:MAG: phospholipase D family protein [Chloroflexota bacterium]|nr:phospholipase D family protein [Chloroflexota bacterium]